MSMEEEQARQAAEEQTRQPATNVSASTERTASDDAADIDADEEALLQRAIAMSEGRDVEMGKEQGDDDSDEMDEEEAIARAIEMSMKQGQGEQKKQ